MGLNVNLARMLNLPATLPCPSCGKEIKTRFHEYDIECGNPNPAPGVWKLDYYCHACETPHVFGLVIPPPQKVNV